MTARLASDSADGSSKCAQKHGTGAAKRRTWLGRHELPRRRRLKSLHRLA